MLVPKALRSGREVRQVASTTSIAAAEALIPASFMRALAACNKTLTAVVVLKIVDRRETLEGLSVHHRMEINHLFYLIDSTTGQKAEPLRTNPSYLNKAGFGPAIAYSHALTRHRAGS